MIKKLVAISGIIAMTLSINPIVANAEWKSDKYGWWYTEGSSWATGWRNINGNWYYFYSNGYMAHDTTIEGYYLNSSGAWTNNTSSVDELAKEHLNSLTPEYKRQIYGNISDEQILQILISNMNNCGTWEPE